MASFPTLRSGRVTMYGAERETRFRTTVVQFVGDQEQRWRSQAPLTAWTLRLIDIDGYDLANVLAFWRSMKGKFDSTWDITVAGVLYSNMAFDQDEFSAVEAKPERYTVELRCLQTRKN